MLSLTIEVADYNQAVTALASDNGSLYLSVNTKVLHQSVTPNNWFNT